jgi:hypothetical protein
METQFAELLKTPGDATPRSIRMNPELKLLVKSGSESRGISVDRFIRLAVVNALIQDGLVGDRAA